MAMVGARCSPPGPKTREDSCRVFGSPPDPNRKDARRVFFATGPELRWSAPGVRHRARTARIPAECLPPDPKEYQEECQKICQKMCQKECQKECQEICQKQCQKICQKACQIGLCMYFSCTVHVLRMMFCMHSA